MASTRLELQSELESVDGVSAVYFQPPESVKMEYPCIVYSVRSGDSIYADDGTYRYDKGYDVTVIDRDPDSRIPDLIATTFPYCRYDRHYVSDNLHHDVFVIFTC